MVAEYRSTCKMYQSGRIPSKKHRALPSGLSTTVACTRVDDYDPKLYAVDYRRAEYHGSMYQSGRLSSEKCRALLTTWWLNTAVPGKCYQPQKSLPRRAEPEAAWNKVIQAAWNEITEAAHNVPQVGLSFSCGSATPNTGRSACRLCSGAVSIPPQGICH